MIGLKLMKQAWKGYLLIGALTLMVYVFHPVIQMQVILFGGVGILAVLAMLLGLWLLRPQPRTAWIFFICGQCLNTVGDFLFINQVYLANPAIPDLLDQVFYTLGNLCFLIGLGVIFFSFRRFIQRNALINGLIVATALFCVIWVVQIYPNLSPSMTLEKWLNVMFFPAFMLVIGVVSSVFLMTPIGSTWSYRFLFLTLLFYGMGLFFYNLIDAASPLTAALRDGWLPVLNNAAYSTAYFCLAACRSEVLGKRDEVVN